MHFVSRAPVSLMTSNLYSMSRGKDVSRLFSNYFILVVYKYREREGERVG